MEDGWSVRMAESLPTLSRPESEEAKPGSWEADGSPATGQRLYGEWRLGPTGNLWVAWTAETGFRPGIFWVHHSLVHSHPKIAASNSLLSSSGHSEPGRNHLGSLGLRLPWLHPDLSMGPYCSASPSSSDACDEGFGKHNIITIPAPEGLRPFSRTSIPRSPSILAFPLNSCLCFLLTL